MLQFANRTVHFVVVSRAWRVWDYALRATPLLRIFLSYGAFFAALCVEFVQYSFGGVWEQYGHEQNAVTLDTTAYHGRSMTVYAGWRAIGTTSHL